MGQWGEFIKKCYLMFSYTFLAFLFCFSSLNVSVFIIFLSFFHEVSNFRNTILTNQKHEFVVSNCHWNSMYGLKVRLKVTMFNMYGQG